MKVALRPFQVAGVDALRASYSTGHRAPLYVLSTGGGKSYVFCAIAEGASARGYDVLILVHRKELLLQASRSLETIGVEHGLIAPGYRQSRGRVQVASVQTLTRRLTKVKFGPNLLIIIDEGHHGVAGSWRKILNAFPNAKVLGVTATPIRCDSQGLGIAGGGIFDDLVLGPSMRELIDDGYLTRPAVYAPPSGLDFSDVKMVAGDFNRKQVAAKIDRPTITGDAVGTYRRLCSGAPAITFCVSIEHARHVVEQFRAAGYRWGLLVGQPHMDDAQRTQATRALASGALHGVATVDLVSEGYDLPVVTASIGLRPTASTGLALQQWGRALRPVYAPGYDLSTREGRLAAIAAGPKPRAILADHVGNALRHGLPDEPRAWTLDGVERAKRTTDGAGVAVRTCPRCFAASPGGSLACTECGHVFETEAREAPKQVAGDLEEVTDERRQQITLERRHEIAQARTRQQLEAVAAARGYRPGWVFTMMKLREQRRRA